MLKKILLITFIITLTSCAPKCIVNDNSKYYSEVNIFEIDDNNNTKLTQKVRTNDTKNGLHSSWYSLEIYFSNKSKIIKNKIYHISKDTTFFKIKYHAYSNRTWEIYPKNINGTIEVISLSDKLIEVKENVIVLDELDRKIIFKGTRKFRRDLTEKHTEMKRNRKRLWIIKNKG